MISIIITAYKEEKTIAKSIETILNQKISEKYELIVTCPDEPTTKIVKKYMKKDRRVRHLKDPGKGKSNALKCSIREAKGNIIISTDGDVYLGNRAINELVKFFKDPKVGVVGGKPVTINSKNNMLGYWSHLLYYAADKIRKEQDEEDKFFECSGYLFAFRNEIKDFPVDVAEDSIIPYILLKRSYKIRYAEKAEVYVKNPTNLRDWIMQRKRTADAHTKLKRYEKDFPKVKSFRNEIFRGTSIALSYPKNLKEFIWTMGLFLARFYIWIKLYFDNILLTRRYTDKWRRVESTKEEVEKSL